MGSKEIPTLGDNVEHIEEHSQKMAFTQSPSLANNLKMLNNYSIFTLIGFSLGSLEIYKGDLVHERQ